MIVSVQGPPRGLADWLQTRGACRSMSRHHRCSVTWQDIVRLMVLATTIPSPSPSVRLDSVLPMRVAQQQGKWPMTWPWIAGSLRGVLRLSPFAQSVVIGSTFLFGGRFGRSQVVASCAFDLPALSRQLCLPRRGAEKAWRDGYAYTKAGILLDDLLPENQRPRTLFENDTAKRDRLMGALDAINGRFGTWTAVTASQGFKRAWKMRWEMRSPAWTTNISEVPTVRA